MSDTHAGWSGSARVSEGDLAAWRRDTPACVGVAHLNNAGAALMPQPVVEAMLAHLQREAALGGYEAADAARADVEAAYAEVALIVNARPRNLALVENATVGFAQALSAFDFAPGDAILTTRTDYVANQLMFLSLARRRGVQVLRATDGPLGGADLDSVRRLISSPRCRLVAVTWVPTNSGLVQPVEEIGALCEERGVPYLVDACQAVGQLPIDVGALACDYLAATARKFLRGPRGIGFLYVSDCALEKGAHPLFIDSRGATWTGPDTFVLRPDARRFENWEFAYALVLGLGAAARYARMVGIERAGSRAANLAAYARERLAQLPGTRILDRGEKRSAIATVAFDGRDARDLEHRLREKAVHASATLREWAVLDMDDKGAQTALRVSPHYYNTAEEIDRLVAALRDLLGVQGS